MAAIPEMWHLNESGHWASFVSPNCALNIEMRTPGENGKAWKLGRSGARY